MNTRGASENSIDAQQSRNEDSMNFWGASSPRSQFPPSRKWTRDNTPNLIIGDPESGI